MNTEPPMVSIHCITYNHEPYIRQCLEGFVMQKTNFRFEAIVHDDASTDRTADIIREYAAKYPNVIKPIYETENQYSKHDGSLDHIMDAACTGKYIALCEGDDYWIDPLKLQKQVDFLETHKDCSMCFHDIDVYSLYDNRIINKFKLPHSDRDYGAKHLFKKGWFAATASILYRREYMQNYPAWAMIEGLGGDIRLQMFLSTHGYFHYIAQKMSVYRFGVPGSATERSKGLSNSQSHKAYLQFLSSSNKYLFNGKYKYLVWYKYSRFIIHQQIIRVKKLLSN